MQPCIILILEKESWHEANIQKVLLLACALLFLPFFFPFFDLTIKYFATYLHVIINWPSRYEKCKKNNIPKKQIIQFFIPLTIRFDQNYFMTLFWRHIPHNAILNTSTQYIYFT